MRITPRHAVASAALLSVLLTLASAYYWPVQEAYHPLNDAWNGCSKAARMSSNVTILSSYGNIPPNSLLAIIGPGLEFSKQDALIIHDFTKNGGIVLLADDFGTGNSLLELLNIPVRFAGEPLSDMVFFSKNPTFPIIYDFVADPLTANVTAVVLNRPSYLEVRNTTDVSVIATSSHFSFVDQSGRGAPAGNVTIDSYPVMASVPIGEGYIVLVSDASMFMNEMIDLFDNMRFLENAITAGGGSLVWDLAHLSRSPLTDWRIDLRTSVDLVRSQLAVGEEYLQALVVASVIMVALFIFARRAKNGTLRRR